MKSGRSFHLSWLRLLAGGTGAVSFWLVTLAGPGGKSMAEDEPPLPTWDRPPATSSATFSDLLPEGAASMRGEDFFLAPSGGLSAPPVLLQEAEGGSTSPYDLSRFLPGGLLSVRTQPKQQPPTPAVSLREFPAAALAGLADAPLNEYLIDPQTLVTEVPSQELQRLLEFHASEARILLYLVVLDRDQKLATADILTPLVNRLQKSGRELCIAVSPLGEPWRTRLLLSPSISKSCPTASLTEMAEDCIADAMQAEDAESRIKRLTVRLSTRLFWLQKMLPPPAPITVATAAPLLHEIGHSPSIAESAEGGSPWKSWQNPSQWNMVLLAAACAILGTGVLLLLRKLWQWRAQQQPRSVWMLPEQDVKPRLGGAFSGGNGALTPYAGHAKKP